MVWGQIRANRQGCFPHQPLTVMNNKFKLKMDGVPQSAAEWVGLSTSIFFCGGRQKKDFRYYPSRG